MNENVKKHFSEILSHLYINPLERCNLKCKICYTRKTAPVLTEDEILGFVGKYMSQVPLKVITFCGGEVMLLPYFTKLVNKINEMGIYVQIITNASINRLGEFANPNLVNMIVSIDGLEEYHDSNRGPGSFAKCINYLIQASAKGFHTEIFSIVTFDNYDKIEKFETYVKNHVGNIDITYHPRKPPEYLQNHPISNIEGSIEKFGFVTLDQLRYLYTKKKVFPPKELGCYQISLVSDGKIFGCCEGTKPIGNINDDIKSLINTLKERVLSDKSHINDNKCLGCSQPEFMCGIKSLLASL